MEINAYVSLTTTHPLARMHTQIHMQDSKHFLVKNIYFLWI